MLLAKRYIRELALVLVTLIWGVGFVVTKNAITEVGPITFIAWRFVIASIVMVIIFGRRGIRTSKRAMIGGGVIGLFLGTGYIFQTIGLQHTTNSNTAFITGMYVVLVPILAFFLLKRRPSGAVLVGVVVGFVGLALLSVNENLQMNRGDVWVVACAVLFALHLIAITFYVMRYSEIVLATYQIFTTAILALIASFVFEAPTVDAVLSQIWPLLFTGVLGTSYAFYAMTWAQKKIPPTRVGLILLLESPSGAFFGWLLAGEILGPRQLVGCALILLAMVIAELRPKKRVIESGV